MSSARLRRFAPDRNLPSILVPRLDMCFPEMPASRQESRRTGTAAFRLASDWLLTHDPRQVFFPSGDIYFPVLKEHSRGRAVGMWKTRQRLPRAVGSDVCFRKRLVDSNG